MSEPQFGFWKSVLFSVVLIAAVLGIAELGVRGWAYWLREDVERFDVATGTFTLVPGRHRSQWGTAVINADGFVGPALEADGPDLWRIVAVGDSCTYGSADDIDTYPAMLDALLAERERPGLRYEVVNAGISGLNSDLALRRLRSKVLPLEPDLVTIYIGWNDLMKFDPLAQQGGSARWTGVARLLDRLWLVKGLRKLLFFHLRPVLRPPATGPESRTGRFADFRPAIYEDNLRAMISESRAAGARVLLLTLPSVVRRDMTADELRAAGVVFPYFPSAYAVGDFVDLIDSYNRSVERVAREEGVPVADLAATFESLGSPRPYFYDTMHPNHEGRQVVAGALLEALQAEALLGPPVAGEGAP